MRDTIFPEKIENTRLKKLYDNLTSSVTADLQTIAFPYEFPIIVDIEDSLDKYILIGDMNDSKKNAVLSLDNFEQYLSKNLDISPLTLLENTADTQTVTRFINDDGLLAFNAIAAGAGGAVIHDTTLIGQGLMDNPLGINITEWRVRKLKAGGNITVNPDQEETGTWIISSSGGGGGSVVTDDSLIGTGTDDDKLGINSAVYKVEQLTAGSNIVITETATGSGNWKIDATGGMSEVVHDSTLSGKGIANDPLTVISGGSWEKIKGYTRISTDSKNQYLINGYFGNGNDTYFNIDFDYKTSTDSGVTWVQTSKISIGTDNRNGKGIVGSIGAYGPNNALIRLLDSRALAAGVQIPCWGDFDTTYFALVNNKIQTISKARTLEGSNGVGVDSTTDGTKYIVGLTTWQYEQYPDGGDPYVSTIDFLNDSHTPSTIILYNKDTHEPVANVINSVRITDSTIVFKGFTETSSTHLSAMYNGVESMLYTIEGDVMVSDHIHSREINKDVTLVQDSLIITKDFIDLHPNPNADDHIRRYLSGAVIANNEDIPCWGDFSDAFELENGKITLSNELEWSKYWGPQEGVGSTSYYSKIGINPDKDENFMSFFVEYWKLNDSTPQSAINIKTEHNIHSNTFGTAIECCSYNMDIDITRRLDAYKLFEGDQVLALDDLYKDDLHLIPYDKDKNVVAINRNKWQVQQIYAGEGIELLEIGGRWRISCKNPSPTPGKYGYILNNNNKGILCNGKRMKNTDVIDLMKEIQQLKKEIQCLKKKVLL